MRIAALAFACLSLAACGRSGAARLEGHWRGTFVEGVPNEAQAAAMAFAKAMEIDVKGDVITVLAAQERQSGRFIVDSEDKTSIVLHTERDGASDKQTFTFAGPGDKVVKWTVTEGKPITITFVKE